MKLIKDYDYTIHFHPGKANVVAVALSRKSQGVLSCILCAGASFIREMKLMEAEIVMSESEVFVECFQVKPIFVEKIRELQTVDTRLMQFREDVLKGESKGFVIRDDGVLCYGSRMCVPRNSELRKEILEEAHSSAYAMHPGSTKMYRTIKEYYWWPGMKREIAEFVRKCLICQQVKAEHQRSGGLLQPLPIPEWKWEHIAMDFV